MKYIVIELQTGTDGKVANIVTDHDTLAEAQHKYYAVLSAAAISTVSVHAAVLMDNQGFALEGKAFNHAVVEESQS